MDEPNAAAMRYELAKIPLFADLDDTQFARVLGAMRSHRLDKGEKLFSQGDPVHRFYYLRSGLVKLYRLSPGGDEKVIELVPPRQCFAEALLFRNIAGYPVNAEAVEPSELLSFDVDGFRALLHESVETCFRLMAGMSLRLHAFVNEIDNLTLRNATYRLVIYLLQHVNEQTPDGGRVILPATKHLIASQLSIQPETFSRILNRLSGRGLIAVHGNEIELRDTDALRDLTDLEG